MNSMVVKTMEGQLHTSILAMEGYCSFHHLLLHLAMEYPEIVKKANITVWKFIKSEEGRTKKAVPNLGEFLCLLNISRYSWDDIARPFLEETFDRNAKWYLEKHPELATPSTVSVDWARLRKVFDATVVSRSLIMFQAYFARRVGKPNKKPLEAIFEDYNRRLGKPSNLIKLELQSTTKRLKNEVKSWPEFFANLGLPPPSPEYLTKWLSFSVESSEKKNYHSAATLPKPSVASAASTAVPKSSSK
eukprot:TRINITY_DN6165_c0_g2_i3.p1 TRINITY_DN6165_c0_g2~~TRINITY_DN6165_c0_g2_i3.p1  ORF type:complete len:246 (-),score=16.43 TRINITY_DN6165_c0_g2_i3:72-809(-)